MAVTLLDKILWLNWSQFHFSQRILNFQKLLKAFQKELNI